MFEDSLFESTAALRQSTASRWPTIISIAVQCLVVSALLAVPLLHPATLIAMPHRLDLLPPPPKAPTPPPQPVHTHLVPTFVTTSMPTPPPATERSISILQPAAPDGPPSLTAISLSGPGIATSGLPIGFGPTTSNVHIGVGTGTGTVSSANTGPHAISSGLSAGLLLEPIRPVYPAIARISHQQGTVIVEALISTAGRIESAHATGGPVTLQIAAVEAVRQARYRPYMLNGQPTEVSATFTVHFTLND